MDEPFDFVAPGAMELPHDAGPLSLRDLRQYQCFNNTFNL